MKRSKALKRSNPDKLANRIENECKISDVKQAFIISCIYFTEFMILKLYSDNSSTNSKDQTPVTGMLASILYPLSIIFSFIYLAMTAKLYYEHKTSEDTWGNTNNDSELIGVHINDSIEKEYEV